MHQNNLNLYFRRGHPSDKAKIKDSSKVDDEAPPTKRTNKQPISHTTQRLVTLAAPAVRSNQVTIKTKRASKASQHRLKDDQVVQKV